MSRLCLTSKMKSVFALQVERSFCRSYATQTDHYAVLGVTKSANQHDIKNAYQRLWRLYHSDKNKDDENSIANFRKATEAYEVLGNYHKRKLYDKGLLITTKRYAKNDEVVVANDGVATMFHQKMLRNTNTDPLQKLQKYQLERAVDIRSREEAFESRGSMSILFIGIIPMAVYAAMFLADSQDDNNRGNIDNKK